MKETNFLDRRSHYCNHCKKAFSLRELNITSLFYPSSGNGSVVIANVKCPLCGNKMKHILASNRKERKSLEEYFESEEYLSKWVKNEQG